MHRGSSPVSPDLPVQVRTVTRRITTSGNSDNNRGRYIKIVYIHIYHHKTIICLLRHFFCPFCYFSFCSDYIDGW